MLGSIIGGIGSIASGLFGKKQADKNIKMQREFAQSGIQWKVEDAKKAGIHPLYALGAQTHSFQPVSAGDATASFAQAGQDVGRALDATSTSSQRTARFAEASAQLSLENMSLQNQMLASQIAKLRQGQAPPMAGADRYLVDGQVQSGLIQDDPLERRASDPSNLSREAGAVSESGLLRTPSGHAPVYSHDAKDRLEEDLIGQLQWSLRNRILPTYLGGNWNPPDIPLKPGYMWAFDAITGEYYQKRLPPGFH